MRLVPSVNTVCLFVCFCIAGLLDDRKHWFCVGLACLCWRYLLVIYCVCWAIRSTDRKVPINLLVVVVVVVVVFYCPLMVCICICICIGLRKTDTRILCQWVRHDWGAEVSGTWHRLESVISWRIRTVCSGHWRVDTAQTAAILPTSDIQPSLTWLDNLIKYSPFW